MLREQQVLNLVGQIYDASLDASCWPTLLSPLTEAFDGNTACLIQHDLVTKATRPLAFHNMPLSSFTDYAAYYWKKDIWSLSPARHAIGTAYASHTDLPDHVLLRSEIYNDFLKPRGMFYAICGLPLMEENRMYMLGIHWPRRRKNAFPVNRLNDLQKTSACSLEG